MYKPDSQYNSDEPKKQKTKKKTRYDNNEYFMGINSFYNPFFGASYFYPWQNHKNIVPLKFSSPLDFHVVRSKAYINQVNCWVEMFMQKH